MTVSASLVFFPSADISQLLPVRHYYLNLLTLNLETVGGCCFFGG